MPDQASGLAIVFLIGRLLFSAMFVMSGLNHLFRLSTMAQAAASAKVPAPRVATFVTGLMLLAGGLSALLGIAVRAGMLVLVLFLVPTALIMHRFWGLPDPAATQNQMAHFLKNMVMAGAALMIYYFTWLHPDAWVYALGR